MFVDMMVSIRMDIRERDYAAARVKIQQALALMPRDPECLALLGRCKAEIEPGCADALQLCQAAVEQTKTPEILFHLGRVYLLGGNRLLAVEAFEEGLALNGNYSPILEEFGRIGRRRPPVVPFVSRDNPLNRKLAQLLSKLGLR